MHSHVGFQEQELLSAPLIIHDAATRSADVQEVVVMLHDFSFRLPQEIMAGLRRPGGRAMLPGMQVGTARPDLNDVDYDAFLANDRTLADPSVVQVERGGRVRLRPDQCKRRNLITGLGLARCAGR